MVEVRPGSTRRCLRGGAGLLALLLTAGCATRTGPDFRPLGKRQRELMAAQQARWDLGGETQPPETVSEKLREGDQLRQTGDPRHALFRYLEALRLDPSNPTPRERIGYIHLEEDPDRARAIFEDVLSRDPTSVNAQLGLGLAQLALGRLEAARASIEKAREMNPESPEILSALGSVYDRLGRHDEGLRQLEQARALRPYDARILNNLGVAYLLSGDKARAEETLREAVLLDARDKAARNNLGLALGVRGRYQDALAAFREAGSEQAAQNNLGYCYFLNGRYEEAIGHYEKAMLAEGDDDLLILENLINARRAENGSEGGEALRPNVAPTPPGQAHPPEPIVLRSDVVDETTSAEQEPVPAGSAADDTTVQAPTPRSAASGADAATAPRPDGTPIEPAAPAP